MNYGFVTASDLSRHLEEVHGGPSDRYQVMESQGPQVLQLEEEEHLSDVCPPVQIMTVSSSTPRDEVPKEIPQNIQIGTPPSLRVQQIQVINLGQPQQPQMQHEGVRTFKLIQPRKAVQVQLQEQIKSLDMKEELLQNHLEQLEHHQRASDTLKDTYQGIGVHQSYFLSFSGIPLT